MDDQLTPEQEQKVAEALAAGRKIEAIKHYRTATGVDLKDAKEAVEHLMAELVKSDPQKYQALAVTTSGGCSPVIVMALTLGWAVSQIF